MKRKRYKAETKQAIIAAVKEARSAGGKWAAAHEAAKKVGYKGTAPGLYQLLRASGGTRMKTRSKRSAGKSPANSMTGLLEAHVNAAVNNRLTAVIAALEAMK